MWGAVAAAVPGLMSLFGQERANETNVSLARETNRFNAAESAKNREFQATMSNTAHQREVSDLKAANLNPLLSGTGGAGSSTPSGSSASGTTATVKNSLEGAISSAIQGKQLHLATERQEGDIALTKAQTENAKAAAQKAKVDAAVAAKGIPEAEIKNEAYGVIRPYIKMLGGGAASSAKDALRKNSGPVYEQREAERKAERDKRAREAQEKVQKWMRSQSKTYHDGDSRFP